MMSPRQEYYPAIQVRPDNWEDLSHYRNLALQNEEKVLSPFAARSADHSRYHGSEEDHRLPYKRDVDRIVHSKAYSRYVDKTQVAYLIDNDHITHRGLHVQLVSNFARGIAEILRLNINLVEAIALGHDVGHAPFGHEGEYYLSNLSVEYGNGLFAHPLQSCRLLSEIEPLNLGLAVYDGFLCHDGGLCHPTLVPKHGKTWQEHLDERVQKKLDPEGDYIPGTLEGCLVKICDTMSYVGRDIEDAIALGIIRREEVPETHLGNENRDILRVLACDLISHSYGKDYIACSDRSFEALKILRKFNFERIYHYPKLKTESHKIEQAYRILFENLLRGWREEGESSPLYKIYLHNKPDFYLDHTSDVQKVVDFISGMTDRYFLTIFQKLIVPSRIDWG